MSVFINNGASKQKNLEWLHQQSCTHSALRTKARAMYKRVNDLEALTDQPMSSEKLAQIRKEIEQLLPEAKRAYARAKAMEKKLQALWDKFYQRYPTAGKPTPLAISLDAQREDARFWWKDPYDGRDRLGVRAYICPECQSTLESTYQTPPTCDSELCSLEGVPMVPVETYQAWCAEQPQSSYALYWAHRQKDYLDRVDLQDQLDELTQKLAQQKLDILRRFRHRGKLYTRIQQSRDESLRERSVA